MQQREERACEREVGSGVSGLIVRHNNRRLGTLDAGEARERLLTGSISFSEFVDQVGDDFRELLDFMTEHDLHPGRPEEVLYYIESHPLRSGRKALRSQLRYLYALGSRRDHRTA